MRKMSYLRNGKLGEDRNREERASKNTEEDSEVRFLMDKEQRQVGSEPVSPCLGFLRTVGGQLLRFVSIGHFR